VSESGAMDTLILRYNANSAAAPAVHASAAQTRPAVRRAARGACPVRARWSALDDGAARRPPSEKALAEDPPWSIREQYP